MTPNQRIIYTAEAHLTCPYSNATRGTIGVALTVNGRGVEATSEAVAA